MADRTGSNNSFPKCSETRDIYTISELTWVIVKLQYTAIYTHYFIGENNKQRDNKMSK